MATRQPIITLTVNKELLEDAEQCARKCGMNVNRFVSEMVESALAERRLDLQQSHAASTGVRKTGSGSI